MNKNAKSLLRDAKADADSILREYPDRTEAERLILAWNAGYGLGVRFVDDMLYDHNQKLSAIVKKEIKDAGDIA